MGVPNRILESLSMFNIQKFHLEADSAVWSAKHSGDLSKDRGCDPVGVRKLQSPVTEGKARGSKVGLVWREQGRGLGHAAIYAH